MKYVYVYIIKVLLLCVKSMDVLKLHNVTSFCDIVTLSWRGTEAASNAFPLLVLVSEHFHLISK